MKTKFCHKTSKTINKKNKNVYSGVYGFYYRISKLRGIKVFQDGYESIKLLKESQTYKDAIQEKKLLDQLIKRKSKITPKCYGIKIVLRDNYYHIGIVLRHLGNITLFDRDLHPDKEDEIIDKLNDKLSNYNLIHGDLHNRNVMYYKRKYWAIDFTPVNIKRL